MRKFILGDVCEKIGSGATPRGGSEVYQSVGDTVFIRSQNIYNDGFHKTGLVYISQEHANELEYVRVEPDDILLNITGDSVARCCQVPLDILPARVNQHVSIIRVKKDLDNGLDARYLRYYLIAPKFQEQMLMIAGSGGTRNALTKGMIEKFEINAPNLSEQRSIANILGSLDDKIEINRNMNIALEELVHALFNHIFVDNPASNEWDHGVFGDIAENIRLGIQASQIEPKTPYIGLVHMPRESIALTDWGNASYLVSNKFIFKKNEFLFGKLRPYFHKVGIAPVDGVCSTDILVIRAKSHEWYGMVLGYISSGDLINCTNASSTGTKMPRTSWQEIARYEITFPPENILKAYNKILLLITQQIIFNILQTRTLIILRDTLLPRLMCGEIRLSMP